LPVKAPNWTYLTQSSTRPTSTAATAVLTVTKGTSVPAVGEFDDARGGRVELAALREPQAVNAVIAATPTTRCLGRSREDAHRPATAILGRLGGVAMGNSLPIGRRRLVA
jgi:hypothetical protein